MRHYSVLLRTTLTATFMLLAIAGVAAVAEPIEDARLALQRGDRTAAIRLLRSPADQGNALAQLMLGIILLGNKVPQDDAEAAKWFRKAGDQGNADAETSLGLMYLAGRGVPQNDEAAVIWLRKAADQGVAEAENVLGDFYAAGRSVPLD
jgi:uncharacterized protein